MWSENADQWSCHDFDLNSPSLAAVRRGIDDYYRKLRKASAVPCLRLSEYRYPFTTDATLIEYLGGVPLRGRNTQTGKYEDLGVEHRVAAMAVRRGGDKQGRSKAKLDEFIANTAENVAELARADELHRQSERLKAEVRSILASIPRLSLADIEGLVKAHETTKEEGISDVE